MTEEVKHKNGDVYPSHFASMDTLNVSILRHLCPHVFSKDEIGKRSDLLKRLINYHESLTGRTVDQTLEQLARSAKRGIFQEGSQYFSSVEGQGMYKHIGSSHGDGYIIPDEPNEEVEEANLYVSQHHLEAKDMGRETLYVWWHNDSEELAKLKDETKWAMKVGKHNSPNVGNRFNSYTVAVPHSIRLGLTVSCDKASRLEKAIHTVLNHRGAQINEEGSEWYVTNIDEVMEILRFNHLID
jgi:hypothetical protein